jgi:probable F420-dependent oxidoreductase
MAQAAEAAGWEALFIWDHLAFVWGVASADPWVVLAAVAQATGRILLGTAVTPLARRRPAVVAAQVASLDRLSGGRAVLGVGLGGVAAEFSALGEPDDIRLRAAKTDEALRVITALWSGERVDHHGPHYRVEGLSFAPVPVQRPRVPIWVGGNSGAAHRRAARWDGWIIGGDNEHGQMTLPVKHLATAVNEVRRYRDNDGPFDIALTGASTGPDDPLFADYAQAGVTWWLEHLHERRALLGELTARINAGPPTVRAG